MSRQIKYVGPFLTVEAEGVTFTRHIFTTVSDESAERLLKSKLAGGVNPAFVEKEVEAAAVADPAPAASDDSSVSAKPSRAR